MANRLPLVFDSTENKIKELPTGDNLNLSNSSIVDAVNITASGTITATTLNVQNLNAAGGSIAAVALSNSYNDLDNLPTLFSGDYNDLVNRPTAISSDWADITNKPVIPSRLSQLVNDTNFAIASQVTVTTNQVVGIAQVAKTGSYNDLLNKPDLSVYVRTADLVGGTLTVEVDNTGNLNGSVFANDSSTLVDHTEGKMNLSNGPVAGFPDVGGDNTRFRNAWISNNINVITGVISGGADKTVSVSGLTLLPTGTVQDELLAQQEVLQNAYDDAYNTWLELGDDPTAPAFYTNEVLPRLNALNNYKTFIENAKAIVSYDPDKEAVVADAPFAGFFVGDMKGSVFADDSTVVLDGLTGTLYGRLDGDMTGSVFSDDSTIMVDGLNKSLHATNVYATTHWGNLSKNGSILSIAADSGIQLLPNGVFNVPNATSITLAASANVDITATTNINLISTSGVITTNTSIIPDTTEVYDLGTPDNRFRDLYLSGSTINLGGTIISAQGGNFTVGLQAGTIGSLTPGTPVTFDFSMGPYTTGTIVSTSLDSTNELEPGYVAPSFTLATSGDNVTGIVSLDDGGIYPAAEFGDAYFLSIGPADPQNEQYVANANDPNIGETFSVRETTLHPFGGTFTQTATHTAPNGETLSVQYTLSRDAFGIPQTTIDSVSQTGPFPSGYLYDSTVFNMWYVYDTDPTALEWAPFGLSGTPGQPDPFVPLMLMDNVSSWNPYVSNDYIQANFVPTTIPQGQTASTLQVTQVLNIGTSTVPPTSPVDGDIALADGVNWDPVSTGKKTLVIYLSSTWVQIAVAP